MFTHESKGKFSIAMESVRNLIAQTGGRFPVDVFGIAGILGFRIEEAEIQWSGYIPEGENVIVVRRGDIRPRKRFTVAHEIGHILWQKSCEQPSEGKRVFRKVGHCEEENAADRLATELLMPMTEFQADFAKHKYPSVGAVRAIGGTFGVSFESCIRRITELPDLAGFAYWYTVSKDGPGSYKVGFKKGYSSRPGLRFVNPPLGIVNRCVKHISKTSRAWRGFLRFQQSEVQVQIPSTLEFVSRKHDAWACLFGWRNLNRPLLSPMHTNQLVDFASAAKLG